MGSVRFEVVAKICPDNVNAVEFYLCAAGGYNSCLLYTSPSPRDS